MQHTTYILDFDSTLVQCESLDELARLSLRGNPRQQEIMQELEHITHRGMTGELAFDDSLQQRLRLFTATRRDVGRLTDYLIAKISPSALKSRDWFTQNRDHIYVVSGGFEEYIIPVTERLHLKPQQVLANRFLYEGDTITGFDTQRPTSQPGGKATQIAALHLAHPVVVIGDGYTDYEIKAAGLADEFWAFTESVDRPQVSAIADRMISNFTQIMSLSPVNA